MDDSLTTTVFDPAMHIVYWYKAYAEYYNAYIQNIIVFEKIVRKFY